MYIHVHTSACHALQQRQYVAETLSNALEMIHSEVCTDCLYIIMTIKSKRFILLKASVDGCQHA